MGAAIERQLAAVAGDVLPQTTEMSRYMNSNQPRDNSWNYFRRRHLRTRAGRLRSRSASSKILYGIEMQAA